MKKRIMVVDDSRLVRVQLEDVLKGTDYEIAAYCRSGEDAIKQYAEVQPDLVTMDIIMQGMDGLDAAEVILKNNPQARIVMISSLAYDIHKQGDDKGGKQLVDSERAAQFCDSVFPCKHHDTAHNHAGERALFVGAFPEQRQKHHRTERGAHCRMWNMAKN